MNDTSDHESAQASREARDAIVSRPRGTRAGAIGEAMRRFLSAEAYDELRRKRADDGGNRIAEKGAEDDSGRETR